MKKPTNLFKRAAIAVMAASIVAATPTVASAAWETTGKGWNWIVNGQKATGWQWIDSQWYFMDSTGTMKTGWVQEGGSWYYLAPSGAMATGWTMADGSWYYLKSSGAMATGWVNDNGSWYRMNTSGAMITGWTSWNGGWYYMAPGGDMVTGVIKVDGATYAMDATGKMQTGEVTIEGKTYTFGEDGAAVGEAPEATRTFSGAAETTNTGTGTGGTTTPSKPNRPSYGGGSSTPKPDPNPNPNPGETLENLTLASAEDVSNADKTKEYGKVTVTLWGENADLSWVKADEVYIKAAAAPTARTTPSVTLSNTAKKVFVETAATITSTPELPYVEVKADDVTVSATDTLIVSTKDDATVTLSGAVATLTVNGGTSTTVAGSGAVTELNANSKTVVNTTATTVNAKADVDVASGKTVGTLNATAEITVGGEGTVTTVEATAPVIVDGATVTTINTTDDVTVSAGTVTTVNVSEDATGTVEVVVESGATVTTVTKAGEADVTISGDGSKPAGVTTAAAKPVEGTDFIAKSASKAEPEGIELKAAAADKNLQYSTDGSSWTDLNTTGVKTAGTYQVRTKAEGESGQDGYVAPSVAVTVTIKAFTGFADDGFYYTDSTKKTDAGWVTDGGKDYYLNASGQKTTNAWQVKDAVEHFLGADGAVSVTFTPANVAVTNGSFTNGLSNTTAKLYTKDGDTSKEFVFTEAEPGEYTLYAGVTVGSEVKLSTTSKAITIEAEEETKEPLDKPALNATNVTTKGGADGTITITNPVEGATYILLDETGKVVDGKELTNNAFTGLSAGNYKVKVEKEGFESAESAVTISDGEDEEVEAPAKPEGTPTKVQTEDGTDGEIAVTNPVDGVTYTLYKANQEGNGPADNAETTEFKDGKFSGLAAGDYYIKAAKDGKETLSDKITVEPYAAPEENPGGAE